MMRKHHYPLLSRAISALCGTLWLSAAHAQIQPKNDLLELSLEDLLTVQITTMATGAKQRTTDAPAATTVISAADIKAMGARQLGEVLATVPGLHAGINDHYQDVYAIRGIASFSNPETLMMLNGVPISTLFTGGYSYVWGGMPVNSIARIEIIRGPGSAVHGADAYGGAINIITKTRDDMPRNELGVQAGNFGTKGAWLNSGTEWGQWKLAANLEFSDNAGSDEMIDQDLQSQLDAFMGTDASLAPGEVSNSREQVDMHLNAQYQHWQLQGSYQGRSDVGRGVGDAGALDPHVRFSDDRYQFDAIYHNPDLSEHWDVTAKTGYQHSSFDTERDQRLFPPGSKVFCEDPTDTSCNYPEGVIGNPAVKEAHWRANMSAFYKGFDKHLLRVGAGYHLAELTEVKGAVNFLGFDPLTGEDVPAGSRLVDITDTPFIFTKEGERENYYAFLQDTWTLDDNWEVTIGLRYDDYPDFESTFTPRLAVVWQANEQATLKLLYGEAFRAPPAFSELYNNTNVDMWSAGNPDLELETLSTWEAALGYQIRDNLRSDLNVFYYHRENVIGSTDTSFGNIGNVSGYGAEWEIRWNPLKKLALYAYYAYQRSKADDSGAVTPDLPLHQAYVRANWEWQPDWHLSAQVKWVGERKRATIDTRPALDGYSSADLTLRRVDIAKHWEFSLSVRNLFDSDARSPSEMESDGMASVPSDYPLTGRSWFVEARYRF